MATLTVLGVAAAICGLAALMPKPIPCLESHIERRHVPAHSQNDLVPVMNFDGHITLHIDTVSVPARDFDDVICDRYAAEEPSQ